ncbi:hypothetical protein BJ508DRAFT_334358 [Ascobolus immersus RN42]|uniref:Uncharacterized protein n=1 Tax=Ascobolus immersus RN42 TaxID=1160509 RepID=A0A3N4HKR4_ASCIM|nr:hypothetical protein BJ508DRAFT_334358 [Ascobolus immersus RN42]
MAGKEDTNMGGRSILMHALQLACMPVYGIHNTMLTSDVETIRHIYEYYRDARECRRKMYAKQELEFWLCRLGEIQRRVDISEEDIQEPKTETQETNATSHPLALADGTIMHLLGMHQDASDILKTYTTFTLQDVARQRYEAGSRRPDFTLYERTEISYASSRPVTSTEQNRILLSIYGLYYAADIVRVERVFKNKTFRLPVNAQRDLLDIPAVKFRSTPEALMDPYMGYHCEKELLWNAYDDIWQLEAISAMFLYFQSRLSKPLFDLRDKLWKELEDERKKEGSYFTLNPQKKYSTAKKYESKAFGHIMGMYGVRGIWHRYGCKTTDSRIISQEHEEFTKANVENGHDSTKRTRLVCHIGGDSQHVLETQSNWPSPDGVKLLLQTPITSFDIGDKTYEYLLVPNHIAADLWETAKSSFRYDEFDDVEQRAIRIYGAKSRALELYAPQKRIADSKTWFGFDESCIQDRINYPEEVSPWWTSIGGGFEGFEDKYVLRFDLGVWDEARLKGWGFGMPIIGVPN